MLTVLMAFSVAITRPVDCRSPVALDQDSARRIAEREIAARPRPGRFVLHVEVDRDVTRWRAWQSVAPRPGERRTMRGGGGISMTIDRCTGAVGNLHYQR